MVVVAEYCNIPSLYSLSIGHIWYLICSVTGVNLFVDLKTAGQTAGWWLKVKPGFMKLPSSPEGLKGIAK